MKIEDLDVFKLAHNLTLKVYEITATYPEHERFGLISQMRRASSSICMNLMEGGHRISKNEYKHFVSISRGSCGEVKYQLLLSRDLGYMKEAAFNEMTESYERISMMLTKLHSSLK
ncbi:MAG: four helix bundle protein [Thermodesulfovibrio sp. RBG_19FT_COMBO_42_12]|nr:MAG: four helix bundle protein [Thermodesulfovibrio sp. RBG_19FT_COMBO_42_12]